MSDTAQQARSPAARARRRRSIAAVAIFVFAQVLVAAVGAVGVEGINILRSYAAGEAQYSKAQKRAVISLMRYARTRDARDMADFRGSMRVVEGDNNARRALQQAAPDIARAREGFLAGLNAPNDVGGLALGFVLFHNWAPFAAAVEDWRRAGELSGKLLRVGADMERTVAAGGSDTRLNALRSEAVWLDRDFTLNESSFSFHMGEASRIGKALITILLATVSVISIAAGTWLIGRLTRAGARAEERAEEGEERVRDFARIAADWFCELDRDLRVTFISDGFFGISPVRSQELKGMDWIDAGVRFGFSGLMRGHAEILAAHLPFHDHRFRLQASGPLSAQRISQPPVSHWSVSGKPVFSAEGTFAGYRITASNITSLIEAQEALSQARDEAERANKAKSSFIANVSHELRTPLSAVMGFSELLQRQTLGPIGVPKYIDYTKHIYASAGHLVALINDILELSRIEAGKLELREDRFSLADMIEESVRMCEVRAEQSGVTLDVSLPPQLPVILGDSLRLKQVVINLLSNAIKFTPGHGQVNVSCRRESDGALSVSVSDTGIGMSPADVEQAMRPFGQVDHGMNRRFEGTGLGLPLASLLVQSHGGLLHITSEPGEGTRVTFTLPAWRVEDVKVPVPLAQSA